MLPISPQPNCISGHMYSAARALSIARVGFYPPCSVSFVRLTVTGSASMRVAILKRWQHWRTRGELSARSCLTAGVIRCRAGASEILARAGWSRRSLRLVQSNRTQLPAEL